MKHRDHHTTGTPFLLRAGLTCLLLAAVSTSTFAQADHETFADYAELVDGIADFDIIAPQCLGRLSTGVFVFFNFHMGELVSYDPTAAAGSRPASPLCARGAVMAETTTAISTYASMTIPNQSANSRNW